MPRFLLPVFLALVTGAAAADGPVLTKPSPGSARRVVPEASLRPPRPIDVLHYELLLNVNADNARLSGDVRITLLPLRDLDRVVLDFTTTSAAPAAGMRTLAVEVDGLPRPFVHDADSLVIELATTLTPMDTVEVFVEFDGAPIRPQGVGYGYVRRLLRDENFVPDPDQPVLCTLSEPSGARTWWPCHDHPFDNATITLTTIGPSAFRLAAPGNLILDEDLGGGLRRQVADMPTPIPAYLVSLILADQELWTDSLTVDEWHPDGSITQRDMLIEYYAPAPLVADAKFTWDKTPLMITAFEQMFGPYPYADIKYGMALFVFGGAMEHATISSMGDFTVNQRVNELYPGPGHESIVAHELVHQWFGDAVHVGRWGDIWLNEGFARFGEILWLESFYGPEFGRIWLDRIWRSSYAGTLRDPDNLFSSTVYNKGAWILHQLRQVMGHDELLRALRNYVSDPGLRFGPVFVEDFKAHCEAVYGEPLDWFFGPWLEWAGRPALAIEWTDTGSGARLQVTQPSSRVYRIPLPVQIVLGTGELRDEIVWIGESGATDEFVFAATAPVVDVRVDPDRNWLLDLDLPQRRPVDLVTVRPNPFNPRTTVSFVVREAGRVRVGIYDLRGRIVRMLFDEEFPVAVHERDWDGNDSSGRAVASGIYIVRLSSVDGGQQQKVTLLR